jgi:hypothetical protein
MPHDSFFAQRKSPARAASNRPTNAFELFGRIRRISRKRFHAKMQLVRIVEVEDLWSVLDANGVRFAKFVIDMNSQQTHGLPHDWNS